MVVVDMSLIPPKISEKKTCLWVKSFFGLSKYLDPRGVQTFEKGRSQRKQRIL
jgi:hypothetical protein